MKGGYVMAHVDPPNPDLRKLLIEAKTIAMVGASSKPERPSHGIMRRLQAVGYCVIPVNPNETEVLGEKAYPSLEAVPEKVDVVDVFRRSEATPPIADSSVRIGARALWLQQGVYNEDTAQRAQAGGLMVVMDRCIAVALAELQIPNRRSAAGVSAGPEGKK
jgi:predicted CoA-binding protein